MAKGVSPKKKRKAPPIQEVIYGISEIPVPAYAEYGEEDENGFQVFTPGFIVDGMIKGIGEDKIADIRTTILEPTSGDGAFTGRIVDLRLKRLFADKDSYRRDSLRAISTIYSIEMDETLIRRQRNNVFSVFMAYARRAGLDGDEAYVSLAKEIIARNFFWAMTQMDNEFIPWFVPDVAYPMPAANGGKTAPLRFPVWTIQDDLTYDFHEEDVEI